MERIEEGLWHWTATHPNHGQRVSSHAFEGARALIDPLLEDGSGALDELPFEPSLIVLSCRHHRRSALDLAERLGCDVLVPEDGLHEFDDDAKVRGFDDGELLGDGLLAIDVDALSADESALHLDAGPGALLLADTVIREGFDGDLAFVPDELLGDDPEAVKRDIRAQLARIGREAPPFDHLLFAHGAPLLGEGRAALEAFTG